MRGLYALNSMEILSKKTLAVIILAVSALTLEFIFCIAPSSAESVSIKDAVAPVVKTGLPVRLKIPRINVDAAIESAGLTSAGAMDIRKVPDAIAWFDLGTRPGDIGSAVIAGHYGYWKTGQIALFYNLDKLRKGDPIYVENDKGETITFIVHEIKTYKPDADATPVFSSTDGKAHLNLVTCSGPWDAVSRSYPTRLVVFSDKQ